MPNLNRVFVAGHLGRDPEVRYMADGKAVANVSIATSDAWTDKASGEKKESTEWHRVTFYGKTAEIAGQYLKKGSAAMVEGKLKTRKWQDKEGNDRYTTEIVADRLHFLSGKTGTDEPQSEAPTPAKKPAGKFDDMEDDIPFSPIRKLDAMLR